MYKTLLAILLLTPALAFADIFILLGTDRFMRADSHTIIVYRGSKPVCVIKTLESVLSADTVDFVGSSITSGDKIRVSNRVIHITQVTKL